MTRQARTRMHNDLRQDHRRMQEQHRCELGGTTELGTDRAVIQGIRCRFAIFENLLDHLIVISAIDKLLDQLAVHHAGARQVCIPSCITAFHVWEANAIAVATV